MRFVCPRSTTRETDGIAAKFLRCRIACEALRRNMPLIKPGGFSEHSFSLLLVLGERTHIEVHELSGPVSRDTARLSQRYPPIARYGVFGVSTWPIGCDTPSPSLSVSPLESMRRGGAILPHKRGISAIRGRYPMKTRQHRCDTPASAILSRKVTARYGGLSRIGPPSFRARQRSREGALRRIRRPKSDFGQSVFFFSAIYSLQAVESGVGNSKLQFHCDQCLIEGGMGGLGPVACVQYV